MDLTIFESINKWLKETGGQTPSGGQIFRLVHSAQQTEIRFGEFHDFSTGGILLRTFRGSREVKKYDYFTPCYVLERWIPPEMLENTNELPNWRQGSYEPFWVFLDKDDKPIDPNMEVVQFMIHFHFNPRKKTPEQIMSHHEKVRQQLIDQYADQIDINQLWIDVGYTKEMKNVEPPSN